MVKICNITRHLIQVLIGIFLLFIGWQFYQYVLHVESSGQLPFVKKPPVVEGFLPISALLGLKQWVITGIYDPIHPAGLTIFLAILTTAIVFKKGFCSWFCPIGTISEFLYLGGNKLLGKNLTLPHRLDFLLMGIKYFILGFFVKIIFFDMSIFSIHAFLNSPYNKLADIKMLYFFLDMSKTTLIVLIILGILSLLIKHFWCRYLCPYGALQGVLSMFSIFKVRRNLNLCTNCKICEKNCPNLIKITEQEFISSPECTGCLNCATICPIENCLTFSMKKSTVNLRPLYYPLMFFGTFFIIVVLAKVTGHWESNLSLETLYKLAPKEKIFKHP